MKRCDRYSIPWSAVVILLAVLTSAMLYLAVNTAPLWISRLSEGLAIGY